MNKIMFTKILMQKNLAQYVWKYFMKNKKKFLFFIASIFFIKNVWYNGSKDKITALIVEPIYLKND